MGIQEHLTTVTCNNYEGRNEAAREQIENTKHGS
jgi:hypothetical protein